MKELPKNLKKAYEDAKNTLPEDQVAIPYLTPIPTDNFEEKDLKEDCFGIILDKTNVMAIKVIKKENGISFEIIKMAVESDYYYAKLMGYVMYKILPRYSK